MSGRKKATARTAIGRGCHADRHFGGGLNSSSGGELKLYLNWKINTFLVYYNSSNPKFTDIVHTPHPLLD